MNNLGARKQIILDLLHAVNTNDVQAGKIHLDPNVTWYLDELKGSGVEAWMIWVQFLHMQSVSTIEFKGNRFEEVGPDTIRAKGKLFCMKKSGITSENEAVGEYTFRNDKIIQIRSSRKNYVAIFGKNFTSSPCFYWHMLILTLYKIVGKFKNG